MDNIVESKELNYMHEYLTNNNSQKWKKRYMEQQRPCAI